MAYSFALRASKSPLAKENASTLAISAGSETSLHHFDEVNSLELTGVTVANVASAKPTTIFDLIAPGESAADKTVVKVLINNIELSDGDQSIKIKYTYFIRGSSNAAVNTNDNGVSAVITLAKGKEYIQGAMAGDNRGAFPGPKHDAPYPAYKMRYLNYELTRSRNMSVKDQYDYTLNVYCTYAQDPT